MSSTQKAPASKGQSQGRTDALKDYVTVAQRIERFYERHPEGRITTEILAEFTNFEAGYVTMRACVFRNVDDAEPSGVGHAYESKDHGFVNKQGFWLENCESSAIGRALAANGIEVKNGIASREEMETAERRSEHNKQANTSTGQSDNQSPVSKQAERIERVTPEQKNEIQQLGAHLVELKVYADKKAAWEDAVSVTNKNRLDDWTEQEAAWLIHNWIEARSKAELKKAAAKSGDDIPF